MARNSLVELWPKIRTKVFKELVRFRVDDVLTPTDLGNMAPVAFSAPCQRALEHSGWLF